MSDLKQDALAIFHAALEAAEAGHAVRRHFFSPTGEFDRVSLIAVGKAACPMAAAVQEIVGERLNAALIVTKRGHVTSDLQNTDVIEAGHPIPDTNSVRASEAVRRLVKPLSARDLLIIAISGGASALLSAPAHPVTLADKQRTTDLLLRAGATINELNAVRKHLSTLKGGRLAALAYPAKVVGLILSDVIGDPLDVIASGPTVPDPTTLEDAGGVLLKYGLWDGVPESVRKRLEFGPETPKADDPVFGNVQNIVVGSNRLALEAAEAKAEALNYKTNILSSTLEGEARVVAREHAEILKRAMPPACILSGGETTVTVRGTGKGGRNQEFALAAAQEMDGLQSVAILCAGTDGTDGPTDAAGAFATGDTIERARRLDLDAAKYLARNDAYSFFDALGDLVKTGPTGTNVMDVNIMLARRS